MGVKAMGRSHPVTRCAVKFFRHQDIYQYILTLTTEHDRKVAGEFLHFIKITFPEFEKQFRGELLGISTQALEKLEV